MSSDQFVKVFDVVDAGFRDWTFSAFGLLFVVVGLGIVLFPSIMRALKIPYFEFEKGARTVGFFFIVFASIWTVFCFRQTYSEHQRHAAMVRQNECSIVEGRVVHFSPMPYGGHVNESFSVSGVDFHYSDFNATDAFNNATSHGGPINANSYVRICYDPQDNAILRLEIRGFEGEVKDYASWRNLIPWSSPDHSPAAWLFNYGGLLTLLFLLDVIAIERLLLPYVRTFLRVGSQSGLDLRLPITLEGERKIELGNSTIYWDKAEHAIWLRPRGFNLIQVPSMVAKLTVDTMGRAITGFEIRYSSGALIVLGLLVLLIDLFTSGMTRGKTGLPALFGIAIVAIFAIAALVGKLRTMRSRMQTLVDEAIGEIGAM
jgi:hypothetical protein